MARCPECGGEMKYKAPFMVCLDCGLSVKRWDYEKMSRKIRAELIKEVGLSDAEKERQERKRKSDYHRWIIKKEEDD